VVEPRTLVEVTRLPSWAPNLHPLVIHFPIVLLIAAVVVDFLAVLRPRWSWVDAVASALYVAGALSALGAYLSGRQAAAGVLIPGMAQPIVLDHWNSALWTLAYFGALACARLALTLTGRGLPYWARVAAVAFALGGTLLLIHTAEQGARLVYEHGVGVHQPARSAPAHDIKGHP
jgi:uncharacterized membrane protein